MKRSFVFCAVLFALCWQAHAQEISNNLKSLLSSEGKIMYGEEPNSLLVIDYEENLDRITQYLDTADVAPQQVLIEARVVEVRLQKEHAFGINWNALANKGGLEVGSAMLFGPEATDGLEQAIPFQDVNETPGDAASSAIDPFTLTVFDDGLTVVLKAMASQLETEILSAPRIATVNNRDSEIKIIEKVPWAEPVVTELEGGGSQVTWTVHFEEVGIILKVNPTINPDGKISMTLAPEISEEKDPMQLTISSDSGDVNYSIPVIDKRMASTKVIVGNGQTLVIGGLIKNRGMESNFKVPLLGDIPYLGALFKSTNKYKEKSELLILVSPTIITEKEIVGHSRQERYGPGWNFSREQELENRLMLERERGETQEKKRLATELDYLIRKQQNLADEGKTLKELIEKEEKDLESLRQRKQQTNK